jgi:hypothetical protein
MLATTCSRLAVAAVTFNMSPACNTRGAVSSSRVALADIALVLNKLNTALELLVSVTVIVSAFPESSDTIIDLTIPVVKAAQVYSTVMLVEVRSTVALTYVFAISS